MATCLELARLPPKKKEYSRKQPLMPSELLALLHQNKKIKLESLYKLIDEDSLHIHPLSTIVVRHKILVGPEQVYYAGFGAGDNLPLAIEAAAADIFDIVQATGAEIDNVEFPEWKRYSGRIYDRLKMMCMTKCPSGCSGFTYSHLGKNDVKRYEVRYHHRKDFPEASFHPKEEVAKLKCAYRAMKDIFDITFPMQPVIKGANEIQHHMYRRTWEPLTTLQNLDVKLQFRNIPADMDAYLNDIVLQLGGHGYSDEEEDYDSPPLGQSEPSSGSPLTSPAGSVISAPIGQQTPSVTIPFPTAYDVSTTMSTVPLEIPTVPAAVTFPSVMTAPVGGVSLAPAPPPPQPRTTPMRDSEPTSTCYLLPPFAPIPSTSTQQLPSQPPPQPPTTPMRDSEPTSTCYLLPPLAPIPSTSTQQLPTQPAQSPVVSPRRADPVPHYSPDLHTLILVLKEAIESSSSAHEAAFHLETEVLDSLNATQAAAARTVALSQSFFSAKGRAELSLLAVEQARLDFNTVVARRRHHSREEGHPGEADSTTVADAMLAEHMAARSQKLSAATYSNPSMQAGVQQAQFYADNLRDPRSGYGRTAVQGGEVGERLVRDNFVDFVRGEESGNLK